MTTDNKSLVGALRAQRQLDADGVMVGVSRQACDEAASIIERQSQICARIFQRAEFKDDLRNALEFAIYVIDADASDWSDHGGNSGNHRLWANVLRAIAEAIADEHGDAV